MQSISTSRVCLSKKIEEFLNTKKNNKLAFSISKHIL